MLRRAGLACAALLLAAAPLHAQEAAILTGRVIDALTGEPVAAVAVRLPDLGRGAATGEDGRFVVPGVPAGPHAVRLERLGYVAIDTVVTVDTAGTHVELRLRPEPVTLEGITAEGEFLKRRARKRALDIWWSRGGREPVPERHFDAAAIQASGVAWALDFIDELVPMNVTECIDTPGAKWCYWPAFVLQGARPRRARVLLDDEVLPGSLDALERLPMRDLARVESFGVRGELEIRLYTPDHLDMLLPGPGPAPEGERLPLEVVERAPSEDGARAIVRGILRDGAPMNELRPVVELLDLHGNRVDVVRAAADGAFSLATPVGGLHYLRVVHAELGVRVSAPVEVVMGEVVEVALGGGL